MHGRWWVRAMQTLHKAPVGALATMAHPSSGATYVVTGGDDRAVAISQLQSAQEVLSLRNR
jgi:hypothetical protein